MRPSLVLKRMDRLIGSGVLTSLLLVWLLLTGLDALFVFLRQLGDVSGSAHVVSDALTYMLATLPRRLYEMFPNAALIGSLLGLGTLAANGELTALRAAGVSPRRIATSVVGVLALLLLVVVLMGETVGPWGDRQAQIMHLRAKTGSLDLSRGSGLWARDGRRIINARSSMFKLQGHHRDVQLLDVRVFTLTATGQLSRFDWASDARHKGRQWLLDHVRTSTLDERGVHTRLAEQLVWHSDLNPRMLEQSLVQPQYLSMRDLYRRMHYMKSNYESSGPYAVAFWGRVLYPFNVLLLVLCALPFVFGSLRSGGLGKRIVTGMLLSIAWYFLQKALVSFSTVYGVSPALANSFPACFLVLLSFLYFRKRS